LLAFLRGAFTRLGLLSGELLLSLRRRRCECICSDRQCDDQQSGAKIQGAPNEAAGEGEG
jgi:hypothetical protein